MTRSTTQFISNPETPSRSYSTVAHIDMNRLIANARRIKTLAAPAGVMAVVKANAYGHGDIPVIKALMGEGFSHFMVANLAEALHIRSSGIDAPILVALPPLALNLPIYSRENFWVSVSSQDAARQVIAFAKTGQQLAIHVKIDTGMNRLGLTPDEARSFIHEVEKHSALTIQGIWTHLATASAPDTSFASQQIRLVRSFVEQLPYFEGVLHMGNSSALIHDKAYLKPKEGSMYRVGGGLWGISPMPEEAKNLGLLPIMTLTSHVVDVKSISAGETVSYGRTWSAPDDTCIAIIGAGYADGYPGITPSANELDDQLKVGIGGRSYPVVGSVCMDMLMVNLGPKDPSSPVKPGDEVVLFGQGGPSIYDLARWTGRKAYEISCSISRRVLRTYS